MKKPALEKIAAEGVHFLSEFLPQKTYLYFPLLSAFFVWAIRKNKEWKERIFSWKVWPSPEFVESKPDEFVLDFFKGNRGLSKVYRGEINKGKINILREAFGRLYPILGLEDPFLSALFAKELESGDYRKIVEDFDRKARRAKEDIENAEKEARLIEGLQSLADDVFSLSLDLISQAKLRKMIADLVKSISKNGSSPKNLNNNIRDI